MLNHAINQEFCTVANRILHMLQASCLEMWKLGADQDIIIFVTDTCIFARFGSWGHLNPLWDGSMALYDLRQTQKTGPCSTPVSDFLSSTSALVWPPAEHGWVIWLVPGLRCHRGTRRTWPGTNIFVILAELLANPAARSIISCSCHMYPKNNRIEDLSLEWSRYPTPLNGFGTEQASEATNHYLNQW